ncbi:MAG: hypothetical protein AAGG02_03620 [Cyanobacteria bacterium P01_H01_bin.15]
MLAASSGYAESFRLSGLSPLSNVPYVLEALEKFGIDDVILTAQAFQEQTLSQRI